MSARSNFVHSLAMLLAISVSAVSYGAKASSFGACIKEKMLAGFANERCGYDVVENAARRQCAPLYSATIQDAKAFGNDFNEAKARTHAVRRALNLEASEAVAEATKLEQTNCPTDEAVAQFPSSVLKTGSLSQ